MAKGSDRIPPIRSVVPTAPRAGSVFLCTSVQPGTPTANPRLAFRVRFLVSLNSFCSPKFQNLVPNRYFPIDWGFGTTLATSRNRVVSDYPDSRTGDVMKTNGYGLSHVGRERRNNEDFFLIDDQLQLYVVCDGLGGHRGGEIASKISAEAVHRYLRRYFEVLKEYKKSSDMRQLEDVLRKALNYASNAVNEARERVGCPNMATTMALLLVIDDLAIFANVGDSRIYRSDQESTLRLTRDHTVADQMAEQGGKVPRSSPFHHVLTRTIGGHKTVEADYYVCHVRDGDRFVLCTDGYWGYVSNGQLLKHLASPPHDCPQQMVRFANDAGGMDNITVIVVHASEPYR